MQNKTIHISSKTILISVLTLIGLYILSQLAEIFMAVLLSVIIMSALNPAVNWMEKRKVPRPIGITMLYVVMISVIGLLITLIVPPLAGEVSNMVANFEVPTLPPQFADFQFTVQDLGSLVSQLGSSFNSVLSVITNTFSGLFFLFTLFVMSFYLLLSRHELADKIFWFPGQDRVKALFKEYLATMEVKLGGWVRGQLLLMLVIGVITFVLLTILGVPYALPLAVLAGSLEILPNLGPTLAAIPGILVALVFLSPTMAVVVALMYVVVQQIENNLLVPKIMKAAVNIEAYTSIFLILSGLKLAGVMGALLSIPIYIMVRSLAELYFREFHVKD